SLLFSALLFSALFIHGWSSSRGSLAATIGQTITQIRRVSPHRHSGSARIARTSDAQLRIGESRDYWFSLCGAAPDWRGVFYSSLSQVNRTAFSCCALTRLHAPSPD